MRSLLRPLTHSPLPSAARRRALALAVSLTALPALAAPVTYEMNLRTASGMGAGGGGGALGMLLGNAGSRVSKSMDLRLVNPSDIPADATATHTVPEAMRIGPALPLKGERRSGESASGDSSKDTAADGRVLIYWGCSPTIGKGQPDVIDLKALGKQVPPEIMAMAMAQRGRGKHAARGAVSGAADSLPMRTVGWPWQDPDFRGIPAEASTVGEHVVKASFMAQEIRLPLGRELDFLEPMNLKARATDTKAAMPLAWDTLTRARGYDLTAVGSVGDKDVVMWLAAKGKSPMLPGSQHECTIPAGIFAKAEVAMVSATAHGPTQGFAYPPQKPGEKKPLIWSARVRITGHDGLLLGMPGMSGETDNTAPAAAPADVRKSAGEAAVEAIVPEGVGGLIRGIFGR